MNTDEKECPYCAEVIKAKAIKCKHCGADLSLAQNSNLLNAQKNVANFTRQDKSKSYLGWIILGIAVSFLAFTNPTEKDFKYEMVKKMQESGKINQEDAFVKLMTGIASYAIDAMTERKNYILFSLFEIDSSILKIMNPDTPRMKYLGVAGKIIPLFDPESLNPQKTNTSSENSQTNEISTAPPEDDLTEIKEKNKPVNSSPVCNGIATGALHKIKCYYCNQPDDSDFNIDTEYPFEIKSGEEISYVGNVYVNSQTQQSAICAIRGYCYAGGKFINNTSAENFKLLNCNLKKLPNEPNNLEYLDAYTTELDPAKNSPNDLNFSKIQDKLSEIGMCSACSSNAASWYLNRPNSNCAKLVRRTLNGDNDAITALVNSEQCSQYN